VGAEGLPVTPGRDIVIADDPARFAEAVIGLLRNPGARERMAGEARRLVVERYDWAAVASDFEEALAAVGGAGADLPSRLTA
jgi:glycosyltransferase involved in cell wall biosynthesis